MKKIELQCYICFEECHDPFRGINCRHYFCRACIDTWLNEHTSCPVCREEISFLFPRFSSQAHRTLDTTASFIQIKKEIEDYKKKHQGETDFCLICKNDKNKKDLETCIVCQTFKAHYSCMDERENVFEEGIICDNCINVLRMRIDL